MAKKHQGKAVAPKTTTATVQKNKPTPFFAPGDVVPFMVSLAYMVVHAIPNFDAYDAFAPQWLYVIVLDMVVISYLLIKREQLQEAAGAIFSNLFSKLYLAFFFLAAISIVAALNTTEFWVCFVRLTATVIAFFNLSILLYNRIRLINILAQAIAVILLLDAFIALVMYLGEFNTLSMTEAILNIKANTGNKNIFAAGLIVKIPFAIYCIHIGGTGKRIFNAVILVIAILTLLLANARASFVSMILITLLYLVFCVLENRKQKNTEQLLARFGFMLAPLILAVLLSYVVINTAQSFQAEQSKGTYGNVADRLGAIAPGSDMTRIQLWQHAIDYTKKHPVIGSGYGNWKIQSIPYVRTMTTDLFVPIHSHNDFLEMFAELGVAGGLLYLSLFFAIMLFTIRTYFSNAGQDTKLISVFSFLAFVGYSVDAFFNFPMERPISQMLFVLVTAINITAYINGRQSIGKEEKKALKQGVPVYGFAGILVLLPAVYVAFLTYQSLVIQRTIIPDLNNEPLQLKWQEIFPKIPSIPNISASAQPLDAIKGRYLSEAGKYDEALALLDKGHLANPTIGYSEFLKAGIYYKLGKFDSAQRNAIQAYYTRPRAKTYYQTLMAVLSQTKDTNEIKKAHKEYMTYRPEVFGHDYYFRAMLSAKGGIGNTQLLAEADSAYRQFEKDPADSLLYKRKLEIQAAISNTPSGANAAEQIKLITQANKYYTAGVNAFTKAQAGKPPANRQDFMEAARNFVKAGELVTNNYVIYENAGIAYYNLSDFTNAIKYFDKVIKMAPGRDGKSEYFKGVSLYNTGNQPEGCRFLKIASEKGYAEAAATLKANCK